MTPENGRIFKSIEFPKEALFNSEIEEDYFIPHDLNIFKTSIGHLIFDDELNLYTFNSKSELEETEENLTKKLEEITLSSFKGTFLQELKGVLTDYYEEVYTTITGGVTPEQKKTIVKDPYGKEYLSTIDLYEKKLKDALSNLK